jgi:hypothetical protein
MNSLPVLCILLMNNAYPMNFYKNYKKNLSKTNLDCIIVAVLRLDFYEFFIHPCFKINVRGFL